MSVPCPIRPKFHVCLKVLTPGHLHATLVLHYGATYWQQEAPFVVNKTLKLDLLETKIILFTKSRTCKYHNSVYSLNRSKLNMSQTISENLVY